jgi:hypothetical protein
MKKWILISVFALLSSPSWAINKGGFFVEPMITYERGDGDVDFPSPLGSSNADTRGFGTGARLGFHLFESLFIGADGRYSFASFDDDATNINTEARSWNYGPVVGLQMPFLVGLRAWAGWIMGGELDPESSKGINTKFRDANGYRLGAGLKIGWSSLNLEYQSITYDDTKISGSGFSGSTSGIELENQAWVLSLSFPLSL